MDDVKNIQLSIPEGLYRINKDIKNPKPDRRARDRFWLAPVFKKGSYMRVRKERVSPEEHTQRISIGEPFDYFGPTLRYHSSEKGDYLPKRTSDFYDDKQEKVSAILPHLDRVDPSNLDELRMRYHCDHSTKSILEYLIKAKKVSFEDVREAMRMHEEDSNAFWKIVDSGILE